MCVTVYRYIPVICYTIIYICLFKWICPHAAVSLISPYEIHTLRVLLQLEYKTKQLIDRNTDRKARILSLTTYGFDKF